MRKAEDTAEGRARGRLVFVSENGKGVDFVADEVDLVSVKKTRWLRGNTERVREQRSREIHIVYLAQTSIRSERSWGEYTSPRGLLGCTSMKALTRRPS